MKNNGDDMGTAIAKELLKGLGIAMLIGLSAFVILFCCIG